jgi:hypothetical protein
MFLKEAAHTMQARVLLTINNKLQSQVQTMFDWCERYMACTVFKSKHLEVGKNLPLDCRPVVMLQRPLC